MDSQLVTKVEFESDIHSSTPFVNDVSHLQNSVRFFPLYLTNYLIGLTFWAFPIGLKCMAWSGTNKTLAPMGLGLFCQLLTSPKLPLTIFNTTI